MNICRERADFLAFHFFSVLLYVVLIVGLSIPYYGVLRCENRFYRFLIIAFLSSLNSFNAEIHISLMDYCGKVVQKHNYTS